MIEFQDLVPHAHALTQGRACVPMRSTLRHPQKSLMVKKEAMGKREEPRTEAVDQIAIEIKLHDRIEVGPGTLVRTASIQNPEVAPVGVRKHPADRPHHPPRRKSLPSESGTIGIRRRRLCVNPIT